MASAGASRGHGDGFGNRRRDAGIRVIGGVKQGLRPQRAGKVRRGEDQSVSEREE